MKVIYLILGLLSLGLGVVGIYLPILPTTPLLLLAAFCFARSSEKLDTWFKGTNIYKKYLSHYIEKKGMTKSTKIKLLSIVTIVLSIGIYFSPMIPKIIIFVVLIGHYIYFGFMVNTLKESEV